MNINIKRIYEKPARTDGMRVLVDRLWPRGLTKSEAKVDLWLKDIAPSNELRKWFHTHTEKWKLFEKKYEKELDNLSEEFSELKKLVKKNKKVTLLFAAKDEANNNAVVLKKILNEEK